MLLTLEKTGIGVGTAEEGGEEQGGGAAYGELTGRHESTFPSGDCNSINIGSWHAVDTRRGGESERAHKYREHGCGIYSDVIICC